MTVIGTAAMEHYQDFPRAFGLSQIHALFKQAPADFQVEEILGFELDGEGEHLCLLVEKTLLTTREALGRLASACQIPKKLISYAGLKDKHGVTRQWFSLHVGVHREFSAADLESTGLKVLKICRNRRKLRIGCHAGNRFHIRLRRARGELSALEGVLARIRRQGVPNYFGEQRFGGEDDNVAQAEAMFSQGRIVKDRFLRGLYLSAARAFLFNQYLAARVADGTWHQYLEGDVMALEGSNSIFRPEGWDEDLQKRLDSLDIHPSGPLWGAGELPSRSVTASREADLAQTWPVLCDGLARFGLTQARRPLRLKVEDLRGSVQDGEDLVLEFALGRGSYATTVLRELAELEHT